MLNAEIICIGKCNESFAREGCAEYVKRLTPYIKLKITELDEVRLKDESEAEKSRVINAEGAKILGRISKRQSYIVAMCIEGNQMTSEQFASLLDNAAMQKGSITFIIGGSLGLSDEVKRSADRLLSMSKMTFPHQLARLVLCEQIYRGAMISAGTKYHK